MRNYVRVFQPKRWPDMGKQTLFQFAKHNWFISLTSSKPGFHSPNFRKVICGTNLVLVRPKKWPYLVTASGFRLLFVCFRNTKLAHQIAPSLLQNPHIVPCAFIRCYHALEYPKEFIIFAILFDFKNTKYFCSREGYWLSWLCAPLGSSNFTISPPFFRLSFAASMFAHI